MVNELSKTVKNVCRKAVIFLHLLWNQLVSSAKISKPCCRHNMPQRSTAKLFVELGRVKTVIFQPLFNKVLKLCQLNAHEDLGTISLNFYPAGISQETHLQTQWLCLRRETLRYLLLNYSHRLIPLTQFHRKHTRLATSHDRNSLWRYVCGQCGRAARFQTCAAFREADLPSVLFSAFLVCPVSSGWLKTLLTQQKHCQR